MNIVLYTEKLLRIKSVRQKRKIKIIEMLHELRERTKTLSLLIDEKLIQD